MCFVGGRITQHHHCSGARALAGKVLLSERHITLSLPAGHERQGLGQDLVPGSVSKLEMGSRLVHDKVTVVHTCGMGVHESWLRVMQRGS